MEKLELNQILQEKLESNTTSNLIKLYLANVNENNHFQDEILIFSIENLVNAINKFSVGDDEYKADVLFEILKNSKNTCREYILIDDEIKIFSDDDLREYIIECLTNGILDCNQYTDDELLANIDFLVNKAVVNILYN